MRLENAVRLAAKGLTPLVAPWFWFSRWVVDNAFLLRKGSPEVGRCSPVAFPLVGAYLVARFLARAWRLGFAQYAVPRYKAWTPLHYAKGGRGYGALEEMGPKARLAAYHAQKSRLAHFLDRHGLFFPYRDGDSFLDAGCGLGQNIRELAHRYPNSPIFGFDVNSVAVDTIRAAEAGKGRIRVETGDLMDPAVLARYGEGASDHVLLAHVMGFLTGRDIRETREMRQALVDRLVHVARRSVLILDPLGMGETFGLEIEQKHRCRIHDDLTAYFAKHAGQGEYCAMHSPETQALLFIKKDA